MNERRKQQWNDAEFQIKFLKPDFTCPDVGVKIDIPGSAECFTELCIFNGGLTGGSAFRDTNLQIKSLFPSPLNDVELGRAGVPGCEVVGAVSQRLLIGFSAAEKGCRPLEATWPTCSNPCCPSVRSFPSYSCTFIRFSEIELIEPACWSFLPLGLLSSVVTNRERKTSRGEGKGGKKEKKGDISRYRKKEKRKDPPGGKLRFLPWLPCSFSYPQVYIVGGWSSACFIYTIFQREDFVRPFLSFFLSVLLQFADFLQSICVTKFSISFNIEAVKGSFENSLDIWNWIKFILIKLSWTKFNSNETVFVYL